MAQIRTTYRYEADLDKGTREVTLHHPLMQMDALADAFDVAILRGGEAVNVDGMEATAYLFLAGQQATIPLRGSVSGNHAVVVLPSECYATPGYASLTLQLTEGEVRHSVLRVSLCIAQTSSSKVIGGGDVFPSLAEIVERMNTMDAAATDAHSAAEAARSAIEALNTLFPHEHFSTAQLERVAGPVTNKEYWFFVNARWDEETRRFKRIDIGKNSFGIQMQAAGTYPGEETLGYIDNQGIGYWRAIGRDYFLTHGDTANAAAVTEDIGTMIGDEWREFGVYLGWNNCFMLDSYGGMTIGGAGFEIDGNGIYPYSRLSMCKHEDVPGSVGYAFMGTLWNAYHQLLGSDDEAQCDYAVGFKAPIDYHPGGEYKADSSFANMDEARFVIMRRPAGAAHDANTFKPVYELDMDGKLRVDTSVHIEVDATILDSTSAQFLYPAGLDKDNLEIVRAYAVTADGPLEVTLVNISKTEYGVLFGYSADTAVTEMKVVCANATAQATINLLTLRADIQAMVDEAVTARLNS